MSAILTVLFIGALLPIFLAWVGAYYRVQQFGKFDNKHPRSQAAGLEGAGARAVAAQQNAWEALAVFTAGVVALGLRGGDAETATIVALVWLAARVLHAVLYLANLDALRSLVFLVSMVCSLSLFFV
jgi:uncharacterized MAPEG superfamily protein